jgi:DNA repair exonuclease SbcCD nuclease subunit
MRLVVFSDIHLHEWSYGSRLIKGRNSRLESQVNVLWQIADYCRSEGITEAVVTGDVYHSSVVTAAVSEASYRGFSRFKDAGVSLTIIPGNHDQSTRLGELDSLSWFSEIAKVCHADGDRDNAVFSIHGVPACGIPFTHDREELRRRIDQVDHETRFLFLHQGVSGVEINAKGFTLNEALSPDMIPSWIVLAAAGHYHSAKRVTTNLWIPGSMTQLNWGDKDEFRGWLDVNYDPQTNEVSVIHLEAKAPKFVQIDRPDEQAPIAGNFVRLVTADAMPTFAQDAIEHLMSLGAESVEVKNVVQSDKFVSNIQASAFTSLNEIIYAFAHERERQGEIDADCVKIGEDLLKGSYQVPHS